MDIIEITLNKYYLIKEGPGHKYNNSQPECIVKTLSNIGGSIIGSKPTTRNRFDGFVRCLRTYDDIIIIISPERFVKEIGKETHPEYFL